MTNADDLARMLHEMDDGHIDCDCLICRAAAALRRLRATLDTVTQDVEIQRGIAQHLEDERDEYKADWVEADARASAAEQERDTLKAQIDGFAPVLRVHGLL